MPRRTASDPARRRQPPGADDSLPRARSTIRHRVAFYETDGMGIVHHANYLRYFELARVVWMDEHDRPYRDYVDEGLHFATTHADVSYLRAARFDDVLEVTTWLDWVRGASLGMAYAIHRAGERVATGRTEHAMVDQAGAPRRIPRERRDALAPKAAGSRSRRPRDA